MAGFAACESAGYTFWAYAQHTDDHPQLNILQVEVSRAMAVLSPVAGR